MMKNLIRSKNFLIIFLFISFADSSYAIPTESISILKANLKICEQSFINKNNIFIDIKNIDLKMGSRTGEEHVRSLIAPLDWIMEKQGEIQPYQRWFFQNPILLRDLLKFQKQLESLIEQKPSLSDFLHMQEQLEQMVLPWVFWRSKSVTDSWRETRSASKDAFTLIKNPKKSLRRSLQEWGESKLKRSLTEQEVQALEKAFNYEVERDIMVEVQYFTKQKILKKAGFSEKELDLLGRKTVLRGSETVFVEIPQKTTEEARLRAKGYNSAYTRGMDEMLELIAVGKQLREQIINPYETHVPYFAQKLKEYIAYMEKGISNPTQREEFDLLKQYVELLIKEEGVTYEQFIMVSLRLPSILSTRNPDLTNDYAQELVDDFPKTFAFPTAVGNIGITALNTIRSEYFEPIGLVNKRTTYDKREAEPVFFSYHDIAHIRSNQGGTHKDFYDKIKEKREHWPVEKGKNVDLAYHILTHEIPNSLRGDKTFVDEPKQLQTIKSFLRNRAEHEDISKEVIDLSKNPDKKIQTVVDDFRQAFDAIQPEITQKNSRNEVSEFIGIIKFYKKYIGEEATKKMLKNGLLRIKDLPELLKPMEYAEQNR